ncbi:hypothetical protein ACVDG3_14470 [Meridianimarinicoccus sp. RP-17]|uniref:hypothetical protein n=1 Tax=Meridianimarinicoccus zhengii TaxID=2056810 RepID=UPI000DABCEB1|nr:hypothetical protein [Phycocomes zhengii]
MADIMTATYYVTEAPVDEGRHFVHSANCQVLPESGLDDLGEFPDCTPAMEAARAKYDPVNACALCCGACYEGSDAFEDMVSDDG